MKFLIASDLHGSAYYTKRLIERYRAEGADRLVLLGDIYNHGPRNPLPEGYAPMEVAAALNPLVKELIVVKGNCDSDVDTLISEFEFVSEAVLCIGKKTVFLQHGDRYSIQALPKNCGDAFVYGHYHTCFLKEKDGLIVANCGSVSLPKEGTAHSYLLLDENGFTLKDFDGNIIGYKQF